jgi:hypothetical protein
MSVRPWPYPQDINAAARYKRMVNTALILLARVDPDGADVLVREFHSYGETWAGAGLITYQDTDAVTTAEAAALLGVAEDTIRKWATMPHPNPRRARLGQTLLPRAGRRGRSQTYLVSRLRAAQREYQLMLAARRRAREGRSDESAGGST